MLAIYDVHGGVIIGNGSIFQPVGFIESILAMWISHQWELLNVCQMDEKLVGTVIRHSVKWFILESYACDKPDVVYRTCIVDIRLYELLYV